MFRAAFTSALQAYPQAVQTKTAWLLREFASTSPHAEHCWLVYAAGIFSTRPEALSARRWASIPHPLLRIPRLSPAFCRTLQPGRSMLPLADLVTPLTLMSSTRITSKSRASRVLSFSTQSLRRSASRAQSRAVASFTCPRRRDPLRAWANLRCKRTSRFLSLAERRGACNSSPVDKAAETATPLSTPTTSPLPGLGIVPGMAAKAICQRPARSRVIRNDFTPAGTRRDQRNRTQPAFGIRISPTWRDRRRTSSGRSPRSESPHCDRPSARTGARGCR